MDHYNQQTNVYYTPYCYSNQEVIDLYNCPLICKGVRVCACMLVFLTFKLILYVHTLKVINLPFMFHLLIHEVSFVVLH